MIVTNFLLNTIKISGADWLSPPYLHVHNPNQNKNCVAIYSLNLSGNVASAEPGCQHVPGPHLHRRRVPPLSHSQVGDQFLNLASEHNLNSYYLYCSAVSIHHG